MTLVIGTLTVVGMLVVVPLGLRLLDTSGGPVSMIAQAWPLAGLAGAASLVVGLVYTTVPGQLSAIPPMTVPAGIGVVFAGLLIAWRRFQRERSLELPASA